MFGCDFCIGPGRKGLRPRYEPTARLEAAEIGGHPKAAAEHMPLSGQHRAFQSLLMTSPHLPMNEILVAELAGLEALALSVLRARWQGTLGQPSPKQMSRGPTP